MDDDRVWDPAPKLPEPPDRRGLLSVITDEELCGCACGGFCDSPGRFLGVERGRAWFDDIASHDCVSSP